MNKKRLLGILLSICLTLGVVGCSSKESKETATDKKLLWLVQLQYQQEKF